MAQKRMFDKAIIDTDNFMDLTMSSKAIYFLLGMEADDEGFVSPKKIMRVYGGNDDDIKILIAKGFLIPFNSGVVVITNWNENNYLDKNRIRPTKYKNEKQMLLLTDDGRYELNTCLASIEESRVEERSIEESKGRKLSFSLFKEIYPRKENMKKAEAIWNRLAFDVQTIILKDIPLRKEDVQWKAGYIPHPTTYLNGDRWNDEITKNKLKVNSITI